MAPTKMPAKPLAAAITTRLTARSKTAVHHPSAAVVKGKRKADGSPGKDVAVKRSALGDVTNATTFNNAEKSKPVATKRAPVQSVRTAVTKPRHQKENLGPPCAPQADKVQTRASLRATTTTAPNETAQKPKEAATVKETTNKVKTRLSNEFEKTDESLYSSALEDTSVSSKEKSMEVSPTSNPMSITLVAHQMEKKLNLGNHEVPEGVVDFDKENWNDIFQISHYAMDIFNYLKSKEQLFMPKNYMDEQKTLNRWMRSLLVDWMVEIQESFELNHETLYLGVKLVDLYLSKVQVDRDVLQLVGAASMFIASKYDERMPPLVDDFLYICDGAYTRKQLLRMEINILKQCDFKLGVPLSYRFLRRYGRCAKVTMPTLTLARYILEYSLMDYETIMIADSKMAAASLYLSLQMAKVSGWTKTLEFYTGYSLTDIMPTVRLLNLGLHRKPKEQLMTVRNKYSHKIFFEVAKIPLLKNESLK